jgi:type III pantothenate kinase
MWLVLDIGNSAIKGGFFEKDHFHSPFRIDLDRTAPVAVWQAALQTEINHRHIERVGIASVVPEMTMRLETLFESKGTPVEVIHHQMQLPFTLAYETPHTIGTDRLAAATAAWTRYGLADATIPRAVVALDAGTACTCEVIDRTGIYRGGAISAGPAQLRDALTRGTAQLPAVPLVLPPSPIGRSTKEALQAGIMYPFLDGVGGLLARIDAELGEKPIVVATGGWSASLADQLDIDHLEPHLVLHGIEVLMRLQDGD